MGPHLFDLLSGKLPIGLMSTENKDKVTRAAPLLNMLEQGQVYLPREENSWKPVLESEWLSWQGLEEETNDQVDMSAYAAIECGGFMQGTITMDFDPRDAINMAPAGSSFRPRLVKTPSMGW